MKVIKKEKKVKWRIVYQIVLTGGMLVEADTEENAIIAAQLIEKEKFIEEYKAHNIKILGAFPLTYSQGAYHSKIKYPIKLEEE